MFCKKSLGSNEVIEEFPVGRRLAFDAAKGRLWVVCRRCERWNLSPLEERWEAVEACERLFRGTRLRTSSENIGLAKHPEGLELVRIGKPLRPEFAAWRYGVQFSRRLRKQWLWLGPVGGWMGVNWLFATSGAVSAPLALTTVGIMASPVLAWAYLRGPLARVRMDGDPADGPVTPEQVARFSLRDLRSIQLLPDRDAPGFRVEMLKGMRKARFVGEQARRVATQLIPHLNPLGGTRLSVERAVHEIEAEGHPSRFLTHAVKLGYQDWRGRSGYIRSIPGPTRLGLEMALHEEQERRALEGELWILEQAWKEAEEIAAISDSLLLPAGTEAFFKRHGQKG